MNRFLTSLAAGLFCLSAGMAFAQGPGGGHHRDMKPCSQEADPAKCEANRKQMRENFKAAREACKNSADKRGCMTENVCAKAANPAECKAKAAERKQKWGQKRDRRQAAAEACTGKRGDELSKCMQAQREKMGDRRKQDKK